MDERLHDTPVPQDILRNFNFSTNIELVGIPEGRIGLTAYRPDEISADEALQVIQSKEPNTDLQTLIDEYGHEELVNEGRRIYRRDRIGGIGITARSLEEVEERVPGVTEALLSEKGRIVFVGNGFSTAPVELVRRLQEQARDPLPEIVVVDVFDYEAAFNDFARLEEQLAEAGQQLPPTVARAYGGCTSLMGEIRSGRITAVQHTLGDEDAPQGMKNAAILVNCFGPPPSTMAEQLDCLEPGGRLYSHRSGVSPIDGAQAFPLSSSRGTVFIKTVS